MNRFETRMQKRYSGGSALSAAIWVFAIVAVVVLLGMPIFLRPSCGGSRKSQCSNNIRECALAVQLYYNEYDSRLPSSYLVSHSKQWSKRDFEIFGTQIGKLPTEPHDHLVTWPEVLYDHMKSKDIMFCPSDPVDQGNRSERVSYYWKLAVDKAWYGVGCKHPRQKEGDYLYNSDQILLYEHQGWHYGETGGLKNESQITVAYMDSHVRSISLGHATSGDPMNCAAASDGEPMYFNFDNNKPFSSSNPSPGPGKFTDPSRYSDRLP